MANEETIELEFGTIKLVVGKLKWKAFKAVKAKIVESVSKDAGALFNAFDAATHGSFGDVAGIVAGAVSDVDIIYAVGCLVDPPDGFDPAEQLTFDEISQLVSAATSLNPVAMIVEHEKNSASGGLLLAMFKQLSMLVDPSTPGVSLLSQFLPAKT